MGCETPPKKKEESKAMSFCGHWLFEVHTLGAMGQHVVLPGCSLLCLCHIIARGQGPRHCPSPPCTPGKVFFSPATRRHVGNPLSFP